MTVTEKVVQKDLVYRSHLWKIIAVNLLMIGAMMIRAILKQRSPMRYFGEMGIITWFSCVQLLILAGLSWKIYRIRKLAEGEYQGKHPPQMLWKIITIGFVFLAVDEVAQIHETTDTLIHWLFQIPEENQFLQLDGVIVASYTVVSAYVLYFFRDEFKRYKPAFYLFILGFFFKVIMVTIDITTDDESLFSFWLSDPKLHKFVYDWVQAVEDSFKLLAEAAFISAFLVCVQIAKRITRSEITH